MGKVQNPKDGIKEKKKDMCGFRFHKQLFYCNAREEVRKEEIRKMCKEPYKRLSTLLSFH